MRHPSLSLTLILALAPVGAPVAQPVNFQRNAVLVAGASCNPHDVQTADLDGDGRADVLHREACTEPGHPQLGYRVHLIRATGPVAMPDIASEDAQLVVRDFDGDGHSDVAWIDYQATAVITAPSRGLIVRRGLGDGRFAAEVRLPVVQVLADIRLLAGDLEGDGDEDLIAVWPAGYVALRNDGSAFSVTPVVSHESDGRLFALDLDGDGLLDLMNHVPGASYLRGLGDGSFTLGAADPGFVMSMGVTRSVWEHDLDADGDLDVLVERQVYPDWGLVLDVLASYTRGADGRLTQVDELTGRGDIEPWGGLRTRQMSWLADLDGDGRPEFVRNMAVYACEFGLSCPQGVYAPNTVSYATWAADGSLTPGVEFAGGFFAAGDVDGDGRADLLGASGSDLVWRRSVATANSPPQAEPELSFRADWLGSEAARTFDLGVTDSDDNRLRYRVVAFDLPDSIRVRLLDGRLLVEPDSAPTTASGEITVEVDDTAGGLAHIRVRLQVDGLMSGGGAPDPLALLLLLGFLVLQRNQRAT